MSLLLEQLTTFFMLVGAGLIMGLVFDIYRISRWLVKLPQLIVHSLDLLIWLVLALAVFYLLILGNWGELRFYVFLGLIIGIAVYFIILSKKTIKAILIIISFLKKLGRFIIQVLTYPIKLIGIVLVVPLGIISFVIGKTGKVMLLPVRCLKQAARWLAGKTNSILKKKR